MKITSRVLFFPALLAIPFALSGCARDGSTLAALRENPIIRNAARAVLIGKIHDRATIAARDGDKEALAAAADELGKIDPVAAAEQLVLAGVELDQQAMLSEDPKRKQTLEAQASEKYRQAMRIAPEFPSRNASLLNALGYFLADRGHEKNDFQTAERLTRASLKIWDESIAQVEDAPLSGLLAAQQKFSRANTRDSLAWALFRLGKFQAAKTEQTNSLKEAQAFAGEINQEVPADLYFHMGEIEKALKNPLAAFKNYEAALKSEPDHAPSLSALESLSKELSKTPLKQPLPGKPAPKPEDALPGNPIPEEFPPVPVIPRGTLEARTPERASIEHS